MTDTEWERRLEQAWATFDERTAAEQVALIDRLTAELPPGDPRAAYERGGAYDSTGQEELAVPLYREALAAGLPDTYRRQCVIQLASTLRNIGHAPESVAMLTHELAEHSDNLDDAVRAFLALALSEVGMERAALSLVLGALAPHLPQYQRSVTEYARLLTEPEG